MTDQTLSGGSGASGGGGGGGCGADGVGVGFMDRSSQDSTIDFNTSKTNIEKKFRDRYFQMLTVLI